MRVIKLCASSVVPRIMVEWSGMVRCLPKWHGSRNIVNLKDNDLDEADSGKFALEGPTKASYGRKLQGESMRPQSCDDVLHPHDIHATVVAPPVPFECASANISTQASLCELVLSYQVPFRRIKLSPQFHCSPRHQANPVSCPWPRTPCYSPSHTHSRCT